MSRLFSVVRASRLAIVAGVMAFSWAALAQQGSGFKFLEVKVVDPDGKPVPNASVEVTLAGASFPMPTDDKGIISFNVPASSDSNTELVIKHEGHGTVGVSWEAGEPLPELFTVTLNKGVPIGGIVQDEQGNPIQGVTVQGIVVTNGDARLPGNGKVVPYFHGEIATTDAEGRWQATAADQSLELQLKFIHPDFVSDEGYSFRGGTWEELRSLEKVVVLEQGIELRGVVTDPSGNPVPNAKVGIGRGRYYSDYQVAETNSEGEYLLKNLAAGATMLTVNSSDWAPDMRPVTSSKDAKPEHFQLGPPQTIRIRVVDPDGKPIEGVAITPRQWRGTETLEDPFDRKRTDAAGLWEWNAAPPDQVQYSIHKEGRFGVPEWQAAFTANDETQQVTMLPAPIVIGTVVDKKTGKPLEKFRYVEGVWWEPRYDEPVLQEQRVQTSEDGKFRFAMESGCAKFMVRVEADGYRPVESRAILPEESEVALTFEMEEGSGPTVFVKLADGSPAKGVNIAMATSKQQVLVFNGVMQPGFAADNGETDAEGRAAMPYPESDFAIVCVGDAGWAVAYADHDAAEVTATLEPWGRLEGVALKGTQPIKNEQISLYRQQAFDVKAPRVFFHNSVNTDNDGHFAFKCLRAGPTNVSRQVRYADRGDTWMTANSHLVNVEIKPDETAFVRLGGTGRSVKGRLTIPAYYADKVAWGMGSVSVTERQGPNGSEGFFFRLGQALGQSTETVAGNSTPKPIQTRPTYAAVIGDDGRFQIDDVPAGDYDLHVTLYPKVAGNDFDWSSIGSLKEPVTVPEGGDEPVDLGDHELTMTQR